MDLDLAKRTGNGKYVFRFEVIEYDGEYETEEIRSQSIFQVEFEIIGVPAIATVKKDNEEVVQYGALSMEIDRFSRFGIVEVSFNETLVPQSNLTLINDTVLDLSVIPFDEDFKLLKGFEWEVESFG